MRNNLNNKVILLTGGATGIGRECALAYAREGAAVGIVDRNFEDARATVTEAGNNSFAIAADVSNGPAIELAVKALLDRFGRIDAIHNNAGIVGPARPLHETSEAEWDELQDINLKSVYWTTKYGFEALVAFQRNDPEHRKHGWTSRSAGPRRLRCHQRWNDLAHESDGSGLWQTRDPGQRHLPGDRVDANA